MKSKLNVRHLWRKIIEGGSKIQRKRDLDERDGEGTMQLERS